MIENKFKKVLFGLSSFFLMVAIALGFKIKSDTKKATTNQVINPQSDMLQPQSDTPTFPISSLQDNSSNNNSANQVVPSMTVPSAPTTPKTTPKVTVSPTTSASSNSSTLINKSSSSKKKSSSHKTKSS